MTLTPWTHENAFLPGTIVRADAMNLKLDGIAQAIQAICNQINQKIPNLPATFTGETQIPEKTLPNTLLLINSAGAMDLYPKAQFDADVANAANAALQAAISATNAQNSASQAQVHEQNAEEYAEAAFNSATAAAASAESADQAKADTMVALDTRLGTTGNLGTAAQRNVMTSPTDTTTPNALMPRGAFGLGQSATRRATQLDDEFFNSFSSTSATWNNSPYPGLDANNQGGAITLKHEDSTYWWNLWFGLGRDEIRFRRIAAGIAGAWRTLYQNSNIVGVVSHSAGMPTGGILYYGENPTGKYLLLADGTGFWWKRVNFSGLVINPAANGNLNTSIDCDISQPFSLLNPVISLSAAVCKTSGGQIVYVAKQDSGLPIIVNTGHMPSTSWPYLDTVGTAVITNGYYELSAVGRWY